MAPGTQPVRVDAFLAASGAVSSRAQAQRLLTEGLITVNGKPARPSLKLKGDDELVISLPAPTPIDITAQDIPLEILFEDDHIAVVNKPAGMVTHPAPGNWDGTLVHALLFHLKGLSGIGGRERPGIVHRLDKDTSGIMIVAKSDAAHAELSARFKTHDLERRYLALIIGTLKPDYGTIDRAIGRDRRDRKKVSRHTNSPRHAVTHYRTLERFNGFSLVECKLETGRTHQIRVHLSGNGHAVLGDTIYGSRRAEPHGIHPQRQMLHAARLHLLHPITGESLKFNAPPPDDFNAVLARLRTEFP